MDCSIGFLLPANFFFLPFFSSCRFFLPAVFLLPAVFPSSVPEGGELPITAGGMTVGHVTCGSAGTLSPSSPKGANRIPSFSCSPPSGTVVCVVFCFPQVPFPPVIPPAVIGSSPPSGTVGLDAALRGLDAALQRAGCCFARAGCCFEEVLLIYFLNA